jgi:hypothetical protein
MVFVLVKPGSHFTGFDDYAEVRVVDRPKAQPDDVAERCGIGSAIGAVDDFHGGKVSDICNR